MPDSPRLILLHKQATSGRVRFLCQGSSLFGFAPLPEGAVLYGEDYAPAVLPHPAAPLREAEARLGLHEGSLRSETDFQAWLNTPVGDIAVLLGVFTDIDPPFAAAERHAGRFIALTETRGFGELERQLLRRAYEHVLG